MENILFVSYWFAPLSSPGVHRSINFVKHLRSFGYNPIVIKADESKLSFEKINTDTTLLNGLPEDLIITNTPPYNLEKTKKFLIDLKVFRIFWYFLYPIFWNKGAIWPFKTYKTAKELVTKHKIELIYTTSGPFSTWILGYFLKKRLGLKWVADNRDPYVDAYNSSFPTKLHWYISAWFEKWILSKADHIIVNTPEVKKLYLKKKYSSENNITAITNGF